MRLNLSCCFGSVSKSINFATRASTCKRSQYGITGACDDSRKFTSTSIISGTEIFDVTYFLHRYDPVNVSKALNWGLSEILRQKKILGGRTRFPPAEKKGANLPVRVFYTGQLIQPLCAVKSWHPSAVATSYDTSGQPRGPSLPCPTLHRERPLPLPSPHPTPSQLLPTRDLSLVPPLVVLPFNREEITRNSHQPM